MKQYVFAIVLLLMAACAFGQTQEELQDQLLVKAAEMREICRQLTGDGPGSRCFILTEFTETECPPLVDPLAGTRLSLEQAVVNLTETQDAILGMRNWFEGLSRVQVEQARQTLQQTLTDNPLP